MNRVNLKPGKLLLGTFIEWLRSTKIEGNIDRCSFRLGRATVRYNTKYKRHILYLGFIRIKYRLV